MFVRTRRSHMAVFAPFVLAVVLSAGCGDGGTKPEFTPEEQLAPTGLHFGDGYIAAIFGNDPNPDLNALVDVWAGGRVEGAAVVIAAGAPTMVTATFHDAATNLVTGLDEYEFMVTPADTAMLRFTRTSAFAGRLTRLAAGTTTLDLGLQNFLGLGRDFGPFPVPVTVQ